jgi:hypothetical protein
MGRARSGPHGGRGRGGGERPASPLLRRRARASPLSVRSSASVRFCSIALMTCGGKGGAAWCARACVCACLCVRPRA